MPASTTGHSPLPTASRPGKIVCIGRNYREHARELGNEVPTEPLFFLKPSSSIITEGETIMLPEQSEKVEFEGEIGILIGSPLTRASESEAEKAVAGVLAVNDVTARDLQRKDSQWTRAKGFDTFCPLGPVSTDSHDLRNLMVVTRVNGVERQRASSAEMVFPIAELLSYVSHVMTLEPGDIVATGTPSGIGPLEPGDVVEVEVVGVSKVSNPVGVRG